MHKENIIMAKAGPADLEAVLALQYLAYQSEAQIYNDFTIQPLTQTLDELRQEFAMSVILKAVNETGEIIGSVRASAEGDTAYIGKLIVHPDHQNKGLGRRLLQAAENAFPGKRYALHTRNKSVKNLRLYERCGYNRYKEDAAAPGLVFVYLEKTPCCSPEKHSFSGIHKT
jgi:ribosomal protein S18 acetylase RimI-like enzyme